MKNGIKSLTISKHYLGLVWPSSGSSGSSAPVTFLHCAAAPAPLAINWLTARAAEANICGLPRLCYSAYFKLMTVSTKK
jgi:hypothetical protein